MASIKSAIKYLQKAFPDVMETVLFNTKGKVLYSSNDWSIENEVRTLLSVWWSENAQFINLNGTRYSILQMEPERFVATNRKKQGHLVGAATPSMDKFLIAHISPKSKGWFHGAYPTVARAAAMIETGLEINLEKGKRFKTSKQEKDVRDEIFEEDYFTSFIESANNPSTSLVQQRSRIDSDLVNEVETLLEWIKDPEGLAGFIKYYLKVNDSKMISRLSRIYQQLYKIFYR
ncbi:MAG: hypothetical protein GF311_00175 [Candidatus Lokiarchaeota archaeon]|nr:hypothetical protein [Candidatus Lokiarchaeota archaeon]